MKTRTSTLAGAGASALLIGLLTACGGGGGDTEAFCEEAKKTDPGSAARALSDPTAALDETKESFDALAEKAPSEISTEMNQVADVMSQFLAAFEDAGIDGSDMAEGGEVDEEQSAKLEEAFTKLSEVEGIDEMEKSFEKVAAFTEEECGVSME